MSDTTLTGMMSEEDFIEHFGVKGMKWGKRGAAAKTGPDGAPAKSRKELRALDKATKASDKVAGKAAVKEFNTERDAAIDAARARIKSGANKADLKNAKAQYKIDKQIVGKREARKSLDGVKEKNFADAVMANEYKSGKEATKAAIGTLALIALVGAAGAIN